MIGYNEEYASTLVEILCAENHYITGEEGDFYKVTVGGKSGYDWERADGRRGCVPD